MTERVIVGGWRTSSGIYHTREDCPRLPETQNTRPRDQLEAAGWRECKYCDPDATPNGSGEWSRPPLRELVDEGILTR